VDGSFSVGDWHVEPTLRTFTSGDRQVHVEPKVMQVLVLLAEHAGRVVSKRELLDVVWSDTFVGDEVLARTISELRRVFGDDARSPSYVQTIPKGGYRLIAPVQRSFPERTSAASPLPVRRHRKRVSWVAGAALVLSGQVETWNPPL
jgi:DNA-binding winged helix-turn-helix (wHTH) protein